MKTKILFYIVLPLIILAAMLPVMHSCTQWGIYECPELKVPENIPPVDPDAYNSVDAVYWNYYLQFADLKNKPDTFVTVNGDTLISESAVRDTVKVYGWFTNKRTHSTIHDNNKPDRICL